MNRLKNVVVISNKRDPFYNMTLGSYLMERYRRKKMENKIMFLSTSHDGVFIGSMQNCWKECNIQKMEEEGVPLIRRDTGGGACYVDKGNRLFSLIGRTENGNTKIEFPLVVNALKKLGMDAELQGRNDIIVQGKKVSGSAFHLSENIYKHHGTILVDVNKELLTKFLNPNKLKLQSKGISSIQSRIINLIQILLINLKTSFLLDYWKFCLHVNKILFQHAIYILIHLYQILYHCYSVLLLIYRIN